MLVGMGSRSHDFDDDFKISFLISSSDARSKSDFTDVNSGRAGGGILCRMLYIEFQRQRGLSEFSAITSAKYFDLAFVIILLHRWHCCL